MFRRFAGAGCILARLAVLEPAVYQRIRRCASPAAPTGENDPRSDDAAPSDEEDPYGDVSAGTLLDVTSRDAGIDRDANFALSQTKSLLAHFCSLDSNFAAFQDALETTKRTFVRARVLERLRTMADSDVAALESVSKNPQFATFAYHWKTGSPVADKTHAPAKLAATQVAAKSPTLEIGTAPTAKKKKTKEKNPKLEKLAPDALFTSVLSETPGTPEQRKEALVRWVATSCSKAAIVRPDPINHQVIQFVDVINAGSDDQVRALLKPLADVTSISVEITLHHSNAASKIFQTAKNIAFLSGTFHQGQALSGNHPIGVIFVNNAEADAGEALNVVKKFVTVVQAQHPNAVLRQTPLLVCWSPFQNIFTVVSDINTDISAVKTDISAVKTDVSALKTDLSVIKTDLSVIKTDFSVIKTRLTILTFGVAFYCVVGLANAIILWLTTKTVRESAAEDRKSVDELRQNAPTDRTNIATARESERAELEKTRAAVSSLLKALALSKAAADRKRAAKKRKQRHEAEALESKQVVDRPRRRGGGNSTADDFRR